MSSEPSPSNGSGLCATTNQTANTFAVSNYAANYLVFGEPSTGSTEGCSRIPQSFPDGTSNVIVYTERYATCGSGGAVESSNTFGSLWADSNTIWRPTFCINNYWQTPDGPGCQDRPDWLRDCDHTRAQSPHAGGINVCLGDASVRFVASGITPQTWANACDPRDGAPLGGDW